MAFSQEPGDFFEGTGCWYDMVLNKELCQRSPSWSKTTIVNAHLTLTPASSNYMSPYASLTMHHCFLYQWGDLFGINLKVFGHLQKFKKGILINLSLV